MAESIFTTMANLTRKHNAINLGQGYPDFDCPDLLKELVSKYLNDNKNQYAPMAGVRALRQRLADKIELLYNRKIDPETEITITAGATQALFTAILSEINKGDEVIIIEPAYDCYAPAIRHVGGIVKTSTLRFPELEIDWNEIRDLITDNTKMLIINTPHNPVGKVFSESDMRNLAEIKNETGITLISDEVYEHLVFDGKEHHSILKYDDLYNNSFATYSFGKTLHATGWKMGYVVAPPNKTQQFRNLHQWNVFSVNSFLQYAIADFLVDTNYYKALGPFFQEKRDILLNAIKESKFKPLACTGTYFQLYDYSEISNESDLEFARWLVSEKKITSIPLSPFMSEGYNEKYIRLCFAKKNETLLSAAEKLATI